MMISLLKQAALEGGKVLNSYFRTQYKYDYKSSHRQSIVTEADVLSQKAICKSIINQAVEKGLKSDEIGFIGEEKLNHKSKINFIIDPLDGTTNFFYGIPFFCISIAVIKDGICTDGIIYQPTDHSFYYVTKDQGAYFESGQNKYQLKLIHKPLNQCLVDFYFHRQSRGYNQTLKTLSLLLPKIYRLRNIGSLALSLSYFADNHFGVVINNNCKLWDLAAVDLIIRESGGSMYDQTGNKLKLDYQSAKESYSMIACHPNNLRQLITNP